MALAALLGADLIQRHAEHLGCRGAVDVLARREGALQVRVVGHVRHDAQLDLRIVGDSSMPFSAMKASRTRRPASVRTGMFCRLGSDEASRPVMTAACE